MKVNDPNLANLSAAQVNAARGVDTAAAKQKTSGGGGKPGSDQVTLSTLGGHLQSLDPQSPERVAYLEKLSADVSSGRYKVDAHAVGKKIVEDALKEVPAKGKE